ncbi:MAG: hypothetical protein ACQERC_04595 [Bacteroidota bacterium]
MALCTGTFFARRALFLPLLTAVMLTFVDVANAQEEKYLLDDQIEGRAYFSRDEESGEKDGSFYFVSFFEDSADSDYYLKYKLKGNYKNDKKSGEWSYDFKRLTPRGGLSIESLSFTESAGGERFKIKGGFKEGEFSGNWEAMKNAVAFSEIEDTSLFCAFEFDAGRLRRQFQVEQNTATIQGEVDESGFLHGDVRYAIQYEGKKISDQRTYDHGRHTASQLKIDDEVVERTFLGLKVPEDTSDQFVELEWGDEYLGVMELSHFVAPSALRDAGMDSSHFLMKGDSLFLKALRSLTHHGGIAVWPDQPSFDYPKIKLVSQGFSDARKERVEQLIQQFSALDERVKEVLDDDQLEIAANAENKIAAFQSIYELLDRKVVPGYQSAVELLKNPALQYLDEEELLKRLEEQENLPDSLVVEQADSVIYFPFEDHEIGTKNHIEGILEQLILLDDYLDTLDDIVKPILEREKQRLSLSKDESAMVDLRDSIRKLYRRPSNNAFQQRMKDPVNAATQRRFKAYAQLPLNEKINRLAEINACFRSMIEFYFLLEDIPDRRKSIEEMYTRTVWNPFTYTDMEETVKERLYNAYNDYLFPHLMDRIEAELSCNTIDEILEDIPALLDKMEELREQDTQEKEKNLRREDDIETIKNIFELKLHLF